jgi:hypothetical protein
LENIGSTEVLPEKLEEKKIKNLKFGVNLREVLY